ncbi:MAG: SGNH/GDSL hydrolase family protein, partial [Lachnospiraceae bacterium]|nr:SGNH/GDSL hydrolase family protein [Lachnospiraceae bacterium]
MAVKWIKRIILILLTALVVLFALLQGYVFLQKWKIARLPGNQAVYYEVESVEGSPLSEMRILFLGSSVTKGEAALDRSFVDDLAEATGMTAIKESKSGTTLVDEFSPTALLVYGNGKSYIQRLKEIDKTQSLDAVVVQLSTNDASLKKSLGEISATRDTEGQNSKTITGAMEYILAYVQETWDCPVVFYTNAYYENSAYEAMIQQLYLLQEKWEFGIIDLYSDEAFNAITPSQ